MRLLKGTIIIEAENTGIHPNLHDYGREFLITEQSGCQVVLSLELVKRCLAIAEAEMKFEQEQSCSS